MSAYTLVIDGRPFRETNGSHMSDAMLASIAKLNWADLTPAPGGGFFTTDRSPRVRAVWYLRPGQKALVWWGYERIEVYQPELFA